MRENFSPMPVILTIEDDRHIRSSFRYFLEDCNYRVLEGENGRQGLKLFEETAPDLVLVDLCMPEMDGFEVLDILGRLSPETPVVVVSGTGQISDVVQALRKGAWDYLLKPVEDLEVLRHVVERGLERAVFLKDHKAYHSRLEEKVARRTRQLEMANSALKDINQRIDLALTGANIGMWDFHYPTGEFILDRRLSQILGHAPYEMVDQVWAIAKKIQKEDFREVKKAFLAHLQGRNPTFECEFRFHTQSSEVKWFLTRGIIVERDSQGKPLRLSGTCLDITDRKQATIDLLESQSRFRKMIEHNPVPMVIANKLQELEYCNEKFVEIFGYRAEDFKNSRSWRRMITDYEGVTMRHKCIAQDKEELEKKEWRMTCRNGDIRDVELKCMLLGDVIVVAIHDITQLKSTEARILQFNKELEKRVEDRTLQLVATQEELLDKAHRAGMAVIATDSIHNIGNILNSVNVSIEEVSNILGTSMLSGLHKLARLLGDHESNLGDFFLNDPRAKLLPRYLSGLEKTLSDEHNAIHQEIDCLTTKFNLMRDVVMTQQSYAKMNLETVDASIIELIEDSLRIHAPSISENQIHIHRDYRHKLTATIAKAKLVHVITNLIKNSRDALLTKPEDSPRHLWIRISKRDQNWGEIRISDNGCGIKQDVLNRIFNHGFTTKTNGFGFGLHSCANLMTEMGGYVQARSEGEGRGATFILNFPLGKREKKKIIRPPTPTIAEELKVRLSRSLTVK